MKIDRSTIDRVSERIETNAWRNYNAIEELASGSSAAKFMMRTRESERRERMWLKIDRANNESKRIETNARNYNANERASEIYANARI